MLFLIKESFFECGKLIMITISIIEDNREYARHAEKEDHRNGLWG